MAPRGFRNNNPGNIEFGPFAKSAGAVGSDGRFAQFPDMDAGKAAMIKLLRSYASRGYNTPNSMINRWAPPSDGNPTSAYAGDVAKAVGIGGDDPVNVDDEGAMRRMVDAMIIRENGSLPSGSSPIGTGTAGGVVANTGNDQLGGGAGNDQLAGGDGVDRLKKLLGMNYDAGAISEADQFQQRGLKAGENASNWLDVANTALSTGYGTYLKGQEGGKKAAYREEERQGISQAPDLKSVAKLLMASPDQATQMKGVDMLRQAEKDATDLAEAVARRKQEGAASYNKNPVMGTETMPDGTKKIVAIQFDNTGNPIKAPLPPGVELSEKLLSVDTGLGTRLMGGTTHEPVGADVSKNVAATKEQEEAGQMLAKAKDALPNVESNVDRLLDTLTKVETDPVAGRFKGAQGNWGPNLTAEARSYQGLLDQLTGGTFVVGFGDLRGGGAITEIEGLKAQAALSRLQVLGPTDAGFKEAVADARRTFEEIRRNARKRAGMDVDKTAAPSGAPDAGAGNYTVVGRR